MKILVVEGDHITYRTCDVGFAKMLNVNILSDYEYVLLYNFTF